MSIQFRVGKETWKKRKNKKDGESSKFGGTLRFGKTVKISRTLEKGVEKFCRIFQSNTNRIIKRRSAAGQTDVEIGFLCRAVLDNPLPYPIYFFH